MASFREKFCSYEDKQILAGVSLMALLSFFIIIMTFIGAGQIIKGSLRFVLIVPMVLIFLCAVILLVFVSRNRPAQIHSVPDDQAEAQGVQLQNQHAAN